MCSSDLSSGSVFGAKFSKSIEELLVSPMSYLEMIVGYVSGGVLRALVVGFGVLLIGILFNAVTLVYPMLFIAYVIAISTIFSLIGIIIGIWAKGFEHLSSVNIFIITPLTYLGGIFYSITMLPESVQIITKLNPLFYFVDGLRFSMIGISEANTSVGVAIIVSLIFSLGWLTLHLFKIGWKIRS